MLRLLGSSVFVLVSFVSFVHAQKAVRELPTNINHPSINLYAPYISGDGNTLVYLSDYTDEGHHSMHFATKKGVSNWNDGVEINKQVNRPTHNFRGGYSLDFDGSTLYYTSRMSGLGGYEIWYSQRQGNNWGAPRNMGSPVNSRSNEGSPVVSPDGRYLYFMRCETMSEYKGASGCKLYVSRNVRGKWSEPEELPGNINTGNSQTPRMLADGETLLFASDQFGGKGGLEVLMTKKLETGWSDPVLLDFINDERNNSFVSVAAKGRYMYTDVRGSRSFDLVQMLIPEEYRPKSVMRIHGTVTDKTTGEPANAKLLVFNIDDRKRLLNYDIGVKGEFTIVLNEGASYDLSLSSGNGNMFYSKVYNLDSIGPRDKQKLRVTLEPLAMDKDYQAQVEFEPYSSDLTNNSTYELRRISDLLRKNESFKMELSVYLNNYREDSVQVDEDLTEVVIDSTYIQKEVPIVVEVMEVDSVVQSIEADSIMTDSLASDPMIITEEPKDSVRFEIIEELQIKHTYHNDRTLAQGESIKAYLMKRGIAEERISITTDRKSVIDSEGDQVANNVEVSFKLKEE